MACNDDGVLVSGGDNGSLRFWDYQSGYCFQEGETVCQPGSLDAERGIYALSYDVTGTRLISGEADKSIKIWKEVDGTDEDTDPIDVKGWRKLCIKENRGRY
jgi:pleiotropic regulator 1